MFSPNGLEVPEASLESYLVAVMTPLVASRGFCRAWRLGCCAFLSFSGMPGDSARHSEGPWWRFSLQFRRLRAASCYLTISLIVSRR